MVSLRPMTDDEFALFLAQNIPDYAAEKVKAGNWTPEEAAQHSADDHAKLLPEGLATPNQHIYTIELDSTPVGRVWLSTQQESAARAGFIYDLFVAEPFRHRGVATEAMHLLEKEAALLGLESLALHVFGFNTAARALYKKLGYEITNLNLAKSISAA